MLVKHKEIELKVLQLVIKLSFFFLFLCFQLFVFENLIKLSKQDETKRLINLASKCIQHQELEKLKQKIRQEKLKQKKARLKDKEEIERKRKIDMGNPDGFKNFTEAMARNMSMMKEHQIKKEFAKMSFKSNPQFSYRNDMSPSKF